MSALAVSCEEEILDSPNRTVGVCCFIDSVTDIHYYSSITEQLHIIIALSSPTLHENHFRGWIVSVFCFFTLTHTHAFAPIL
jgi:hypothetical protein